MIQFGRETCGNLDQALRREWLEATGIGSEVIPPSEVLDSGSVVTHVSGIAVFRCVTQGASAFLDPHCRFLAANPPHDIGHHSHAEHLPKRWSLAANDLQRCHPDPREVWYRAQATRAIRKSLRRGGATVAAKVPDPLLVIIEVLPKRLQA